MLRRDTAQSVTGTHHIRVSWNHMLRRWFTEATINDGHHLVIPVTKLSTTLLTITVLSVNRVRCHLIQIRCLRLLNRTGSRLRSSARRGSVLHPRVTVTVEHVQIQASTIPSNTTVIRILANSTLVLTLIPRVRLPASRTDSRILCDPQPAVKLTSDRRNLIVNGGASVNERANASESDNILNDLTEIIQVTPRAVLPSLPIYCENSLTEVGANRLIEMFRLVHWATATDIVVCSQKLARFQSAVSMTFERRVNVLNPLSGFHDDKISITHVRRD